MFDSKTNEEIEKYKKAIGDLYYRMATNDDENYRAHCLEKCNYYMVIMQNLIEKSLTNN